MRNNKASARLPHRCTRVVSIFLPRAVRWGALLLGLIGVTAQAVGVENYKTLELVFDQAITAPANPFDTYLLRLEVTDPSGTTFELDGFYDGNGQGGQAGNIWKARLSPNQTGTWSWRTVAGDAPDAGLNGLSGQFNVTAGSDRGGLVADGRYFKLQDGSPMYLAGNFLDFRGSLSPKSTHVYMSEVVSDSDRTAILAAQRDFHDSNKANIYLANKGDYSNLSVTPWVGSAASNNKTLMDLTRWDRYDDHILEMKENGMLAEMWFFADDSSFGSMSLADQQRLIRYSMARTSAFSHTMYVMALEWEEGFSQTRINELGSFTKAHNPWERLLSVHSGSNANWSYAGQDWPSFIATQRGNSALASQVNSYGITIRTQDTLPHIDEEYGILTQNADGRLRHNLWANLASGAAGGGTGSDLKAMQRFMRQSGMPFQRMVPDNSLVTLGGDQSFALAEAGHHYMVFSVLTSFDLNVTGSGLTGQWFNSRDPNANLTAPFAVTAGLNTFVPPPLTPVFGEDWILWITDGTNLNAGVTHPTSDAASLIQQLVTVLPGDFNFDGKVDGQDFLKWQRGESPNPGSPSDLLDWENNFGTTGAAESAGTAAVPEPPTALLLALGFIGVMTSYRRSC